MKYATLFGLLFTLTLDAQTSGVVTGKVVRESDGAPVTRAEVRVSADSWSRTVFTDERGRFLILGVPFRHEYRVFASAKEAGSAWGILGAVYPGVPTTIAIGLYDGPADGPCGSFFAKRLETAVWFSVVSTPAAYPRICL